MEGIKIEVTGNIARVTQKPTKLTSGTVGLPAEFTFDEQWDGLKKVAVFRAGDIKKTVDIPEGETIVPWEVMDKPKVWLSTGVYGVNDDGTVVIPTIWANVGVIRTGVDLEGDDPTDPTAPIWKTLTEEVEEAIDNANDAAEELREAIKNANDAADELREAIKNGDIVIPEGGGAEVLNVLVEGTEADHTSREIFAHVDNLRGPVQLQYNDAYYQLLRADESIAWFGYIADDGHIQVVCVNGNEIEDYPIEFVHMSHFNDVIGDISTALDHIIEIQEELIGS